MGALDAWVVAVAPEKVLPSVVDFLPSAKASNEGKVRAGENGEIVRMQGQAIVGWRRRGSCQGDRLPLHDSPCRLAFVGVGWGGGVLNLLI